MVEPGLPPIPEEPGTDQDLLARVRAGENAAFGELFTRHAEAVRRFALRQVGDPVEADDLTAEAFFRVLQAIRRGSGPTEHVRTYLLTVARRVVWEWAERRRDVPVEDDELSRRIAPHHDNTQRGTEEHLMGRAFRSLPERWRAVLWQVDVEGARPAVVASHFGLSANAMSALARRAREGLRAAYLQAHLADDPGGRRCRSVVAKLGAYTAGTVQGGELRRIRRHISACPSCRGLHAELADVRSGLRSYAALVLGLPGTAALTGYLAGHAAPTATAATGYASTAAAGHGAGLGAVAPVGRGALLATRIKLTVAAASVGLVGFLGMAVGEHGGGPGLSLVFPDQNDRTTSGAPVLVTPDGTATSGNVTPSHRSGQVGARPPAGREAPVGAQSAALDQPTSSAVTPELTSGAPTTSLTADPSFTTVQRQITFNTTTSDTQPGLMTVDQQTTAPGGTKQTGTTGTAPLRTLPPGPTSTGTAAPTAPGTPTGTPTGTTAAGATATGAPTAAPPPVGMVRPAGHATL